MAEQRSRRDFLKSAAAASVGAAALCRNVFAFRRFSCVVIGAGLSGLSAAAALQKAGWSVTVIDARDRIGGRVLSHSFAERPNLVCELGGEWIGESLAHGLGVLDAFEELDGVRCARVRIDNPEDNLVIWFDTTHGFLPRRSDDRNGYSRGRRRL